MRCRDSIPMKFTCRRPEDVSDDVEYPPIINTINCHYYVVDVPMELGPTEVVPWQSIAPVVSRRWKTVIRRTGEVKDRYLLPATPGIVSCIAIRCRIAEHRTGRIKPGCRLFRVTPAGLSHNGFGPFSITACPATFLTNAALASESYSANTRVGPMDKEVP